MPLLQPAVLRCLANASVRGNSRQYLWSQLLLLLVCLAPFAPQLLYSLAAPPFASSPALAAPLCVTPTRRLQTPLERTNLGRAQV